MNMPKAREQQSTGMAELLESRCLFTATTVQAISVSSAGDQANGYSGVSVQSADGRYIAFSSVASNLVAGDTSGHTAIFVHDKTTGLTTRVSRAPDGSEPDAQCFDPSISADGRFVAFSTASSNLVSQDTAGQSNIFVYDTLTDSTRLVSVSADGVHGDLGSYAPSISADGRYVAFLSDATNLVAGDTNAATDVFVRDLQTGVLRLVSVSSAGVQGNAASSSPAISGNGAVVAYLSDASNLVDRDTNAAADVFLYNLANSTTQRISISTAGAQANGVSGKLAISNTGTLIAFESRATNLAPRDTNAKQDIFVRDTTANTTRLISATATGESSSPSISGDGRFIAFASDAANIVAGDTNNVRDVFLYDRKLLSMREISPATASLNSDGGGDLPALSNDGRFLTFFSSSTTLIPADTNGVGDIFSQRVISEKTGLSLDAVTLPTPPAAAVVGGTKTTTVVTVTLSNNADTNYRGAVQVTFYASRSSTPDTSSDLVLGSLKTTVSLKGRAAASFKATLTFPVPSDDAVYTLFAVISGANIDSASHIAQASQTIEIHKPAAIIFQPNTPPATLGSRPLGASLSLPLSLTNTGNILATGVAAYDLYLSSDGTFNPGKSFKFLAAGKFSLAAAIGVTQKANLKIRLPKVLPEGFISGDYHVLAVLSGVTGNKLPVDLSQLGTLDLASLTIAG